MEGDNRATLVVSVVYGLGVNVREYILAKGGKRHGFEESMTKWNMLHWDHYNSQIRSSWGCSLLATVLFFLVSLHSRSQIGLQMTLLKKAKGGTDNTISLVPSLNPPLFDTISNETEKWNNKSSYSRTEPCKIFGFEKEKCAISRLDKLNEEEIAKIYKKPKTEAGAKWYVVAFAFLDAWHIWGPSSNYFCVTFLWQVGMRRCLLKYGHYDTWLLLILSSHF